MEAEERETDFVGYDYMRIQTLESRLSFLIDCYLCFGWEKDTNMEGISNRIPQNSNHIPVQLHLKRNRNIMNKMELTRLQRNFEFCIKEIDKLEKKREAKPLASALTIGLSGTILIAGSVFAVSAPTPLIGVCILLGIPGILGWIFPFFVYRNLLRAQTELIEPLIEKKREEIFELCEKGNRIQNR